MSRNSGETASVGNPKTPLKSKLQDLPKGYNLSVDTAPSSGQKPRTVTKSPHYFGENKSVPASAAAQPGSEPILRPIRKRSAPDEGEAVSELSRRTRPYQYYNSRYNLPPMSNEEPVVGPSGEWVYGSDANKPVEDMPRPVPMVYYPIGIHNYRKGGPANTVGHPFRVDTTDNTFAPLPTGIEDYSESAMSKMGMEAAADKEWLKKIAGFDPAFMLQNKLLKEVPTTTAAMAKAANTWVDLDYDNPLKVRRRQMLPTIPDYADQPSLHLQYKSIMDKLDRLKTQHFKGALPFKPLPENATAADKAKLAAYNTQADAILRAGVDKYKELTNQLHPGLANNLIRRVNAVALEGPARIQFQIDFKTELRRLHDIRREIKAITHQHDIVWKDRISDSAETRRNKTNLRRQLRAELQDAITRADAQKEITYGWVEQEGGKTAWLDNRQAQKINGVVSQDGATLPVAMTRWLAQSASERAVSKASMARQSGTHLYVDEDIVMTDSDARHLHDRRSRSQSEATEYPETSPVTWRILCQTLDIIERHNITRGVAKGGGDREALKPLTYINPRPGEPEAAIDYVKMARRLEDFFLILEAVMTKVRAEEEIARMELDKPYEPDLPLSTPRFGPQTSVEEMGDAPPLDNSGAYLAKPNTSNNKYGSSSISDAEDSECSREGSESSGADSPSSPPGKASYEPNAKMAAQVNRRSNIAKPGVHFTPPDANKEGPKATPKQSTWRPARQATPRSVPMKSSPDTSIFTKPSQFSIDSSPPVTVTPAQRERSRGIGPRAGRGARNGRQPRMSTPKVTQSQPLQEPTTLRRGRSVSKQLAMSLTGVRSPELSSTAPAPLPRELWPQRPGRRQAAPGRGNRGGRGGARNRPRTPTPDENEEEETQEQGEEQSREQSSEQSQAQNVGKEETQKRSAGNSPKLSGDLDIIEEDQAQFGEEGEKEQEEEDSEIDSEESYGDTDDSEDED